jgi:rod shape determining protein RodA
MIERKSIAGFDWLIFFAICALLGISVLTLYSLAPAQVASGRTPLFVKQTYWILIGWMAFLMMAWVDYHVLIRFAWPLYGITLLLLVGVLLTGRVVQGAQRWISLGFFSVQPSEIAKVTLLLILAKHFSDHAGKTGLSFGQILRPGLLLAVPALLILKQPDLGTAVAISSVFLVMLFVLGLRSKLFIYATLFSILAFPFFWLFFWNHLKDYQKARLLTFITPTSDPMGAGYHITQSRIAIGSGQLTGKGLFGGTQSQLKFLPEGHTDFIFAVFSEAWGFRGIVVLFILFLVVLLWGIEIACKAKDLLGTLLAVGILGLLSCYFLVNVSMTLGVMPTVGIPLPLVSYGGTALVTTMGLLGLLFNVKLRRFMLFY